MVERAVRIAEENHQPYTMVCAYDSAGYINLCKGDVAKALKFYKRGRETCQRWHILQLLHTHAIGLGLTLALSRQQDDALALLEREVGYPPPKGLNNNRLLGEAYLLAGNVEAALGYTERMLETAGANGERGAQAWSLRLLGEIYVHPTAQDHKQAKAYYLHALDLASELGMCPLQAHCHRGFGNLYNQTTQLEQARAELTTAIEMYRDLEMTFWLPETEAALAELEGKA